MKKKRFVLASSLLTLLLGLGACSGEGELLQGGSGTPVPDSSNGIRIVVHTPAPDDIIMSRATHDSEEYSVKKLGVYLFLADAEGGDDTYSLAAQKPALQPGGGDGQFTDNGNGTLSYTLPIDASWLGKSAKIALIANDEVSAELTATTLEAFKKSIATSKLTGDEQSADIISGSIYAADAGGSTGLPMSAMAVFSQNEAFTISPLGAELSASLQRIMARVDVCNNTPNLTITGLKVTRAASQGYLFPQSSTAAPADEYYTMTPTSGYTDDLAGGISFIPTDGDASAVKTANTHKHMFYLYEQENAEHSSVEVVIDYSLTIGEKGKEVTKKGSVSVPLKSKESYLPTTRNNLYTIVVGNGTAISDHVEVTELIVNDWEATTDIDGELKPGTDEDFVPGDPKDLSQLAIGDYYMSDGTVRDGNTIPAEAYPYVIGVVFQTYKDAPARFESNMQTLGGETLTEPHGLVMAVKLANDGEKCKWKNADTDEEGLNYMESLQEAYNDINGLSNYTTVIENHSNSGDLSTSHPAFQAIEEFNDAVPAPTTSTGWFLPSSGQWWDIVANLGNMATYMSPQQSDDINDYYYWYYDSSTSSSGTQRPIGDVGQYYAQQQINRYLTDLGENADVFSENAETWNWSSSEYSGAGARCVYFLIPRFDVGFNLNKTSTEYVRAVLAF